MQQRHLSDRFLLILFMAEGFQPFSHLVGCKVWNLRGSHLSLAFVGERYRADPMAHCSCYNKTPFPQEEEVESHTECFYSSTWQKYKSQSVDPFLSSGPNAHWSYLQILANIKSDAMLMLLFPVTLWFSVANFSFSLHISTTSLDLVF